ncbi:hypothetical protein LO749_16795 [Paracoccus denitrificans]|uniref:hypothetical protein n=1 Tax=Paracoccus denitrificans TaxID=266 RepID=UPI001E487A4E|nr:hypothetical protein [Paracoccus denitrificans]UFS67749.1 hypothetical protein LO749_16795 [Paracoccus denitrificans]
MTILDAILLATTVVAGAGGLILTKWLTKMRRAERASRRKVPANALRSKVSHDRAASSAEDIKALAGSIPLAASILEAPPTKVRAPQKGVQVKNVWSGVQEALARHPSLVKQVPEAPLHTSRYVVKTNLFIVQKVDQEAAASWNKAVVHLTQRGEAKKMEGQKAQPVSLSLDVSGFNRAELH